MIVLDVETTGINPYSNSIIDIGAVDYYNIQNRFSVQCTKVPDSEVSQQALEINGRTLESLTDSSLPTLIEAVEQFHAWTHSTHNRILAGHNVGSFDISFLKEAFRYAKIEWDLGRRSVDLHTIAFTHALQRGVYVPNPQQISPWDSPSVQAYVGIPHEPKPHQAINGAVWEAECFHRLLEGTALFPEFKKYPVPEYLHR